MFCLILHRDLDLDPRGLEADDLHVVGRVLPVRMVIALAFFKRIFTRSLPMNQAHGLIIGEVYRIGCRSCSSEWIREPDDERYRKVPAAATEPHYALARECR